MSEKKQLRTKKLPHISDEMGEVEQYMQMARKRRDTLAPPRDCNQLDYQHQPQIVSYYKSMQTHRSATPKILRWKQMNPKYSTTYIPSTI